MKEKYFRKRFHVAQSLDCRSFDFCSNYYYVTAREILCFESNMRRSYKIIVRCNQILHVLRKSSKFSCFENYVVEYCWFSISNCFSHYKICLYLIRYPMELASYFHTRISRIINRESLIQTRCKFILLNVDSYNFSEDRWRNIISCGYVDVNSNTSPLERFNSYF